MLNKIEKNYALFLVADGFGGHQAGGIAARLFCQSFMQLATEHAYVINQAPEKNLLK